MDYLGSQTNWSKVHGFDYSSTKAIFSGYYTV